jgi:patatin-like phospholipase/acyl hydrolase
MSYRILSLDGGGTWALIQVKAPIALCGENTDGRAVLEDFDLVTANSGGSIVLGGLVEGLTLGQILALFQDQTVRQSIFSPNHSFGDKVLHDLTGLEPKYSAENKLPALQNAFPTKGAVRLDQVAADIQRPGTNADVHLLITSFRLRP